MGQQTGGDVLHESNEGKETLRLYGDLKETEHEISKIPMEYEGYKGTGDTEDELHNELSEDQKRELELFKSYMYSHHDWKETFSKIPRKKNGTFAKNRVLVLAQGHEFSYESEEEYGMRGPELRIKTHTDTEAYLEFHSTIIDKW